jgi:pyrimidine deaminase RibD-like protein
MAGSDDDVRVDIDLGEAEREADRIRTWLIALRRRHDLARFEYTRHVRIVPAGPTYSHPILTLGTRFTETEDLLLSTYLHEQMHWYLWLLGGPDHDPVAPFFDVLVRRYPQAPIWLPEGARSYEQTYMHLVVCWLEVEAAAELIGRARANRILDSERLTGCDLYVTLEPCPMCAAAISFARVRRLYYGPADPKSGGVESGPRIFSHPTCHHAPEVYPGLAEAESRSLLESFFAALRVG